MCKKVVTVEQLKEGARRSAALSTRFAEATATAIGVKQDKLTGVPGQVVGFDTSGAALAVHGWSNPNLLDNWYFVYLINQREKLEYAEPGYTIDRWKIADNNTKILVGNGYVTVQKKGSGLAQFIQLTEIPISSKDTTFTFSVLDVNNVLTTITGIPSTVAAVPVSFGYMAIAIYSGRIGVNVALNNVEALSIVAVKLEIGSQQTLAHQDTDGNWVLNDPPPNYALELAKCQRYLFPVPSNCHPIPALVSGANTGGLTCSILTRGMAKVPTFTGVPTKNVRFRTVGVDIIPETQYTLEVSGNSVLIGFTYSVTKYPGLSAYSAVMYFTGNEKGFLDANL